MAGRFKIGELVRHKKSDKRVFVVEFELLSADEGDAPSLYQCSETMLIGYERHIYHENDLLPAGEVKPIEKPGTLKWSTTILRDMLDMAKHGGMREKRAAELHEEFVDHWNVVEQENDAGEAMRAMLRRIKVFAELGKGE